MFDLGARDSGHGRSIVFMFGPRGVLSNCWVRMRWIMGGQVMLGVCLTSMFPLIIGSKDCVFFCKLRSCSGGECRNPKFMANQAGFISPVPAMLYAQLSQLLAGVEDPSLAGQAPMWRSVAPGVGGLDVDGFGA